MDIAKIAQLAAQKMEGEDSTLPPELGEGLQAKTVEAAEDNVGLDTLKAMFGANESARNSDPKPSPKSEATDSSPTEESDRVKNRVAEIKKEHSLPDTFSSREEFELAVEGLGLSKKHTSWLSSHYNLPQSTTVSESNRVNLGDILDPKAFPAKLENYITADEARSEDNSGSYGDLAATFKRQGNPKASSASLAVSKAYAALESSLTKLKKEL